MKNLKRFLKSIFTSVLLTIGSLVIFDKAYFLVNNGKNVRSSTQTSQVISNIEKISTEDRPTKREEIFVPKYHEQTELYILNISSNIGISTPAELNFETPNLNQPNPRNNVLLKQSDFATNNAPRKRVVDLDSRLTETTAKYYNNFDAPIYAVSSTESYACNKSTELKYSTSQHSMSSQKNSQWCRMTAQNRRVVIGRSWGTMNKYEKEEWDKLNCNELLSIGKLQSCDQRFGWSFMSQWMENKKVVLKGMTEASCIINLKTSTFCEVISV